VLRYGGTTERQPRECAPARPPCSQLQRRHAPRGARALLPQAPAWSTRRSGCQSSARLRLRPRGGCPWPPPRPRRSSPARLRRQTRSACASFRPGKPSASGHNAPAALTRCPALALGPRENTRAQRRRPWRRSVLEKRAQNPMGCPRGEPDHASRRTCTQSLPSHAPLARSGSEQRLAFLPRGIVSLVRAGLAQGGRVWLTPSLSPPPAWTLDPPSRRGGAQLVQESPNLASSSIFSARSRLQCACRPPYERRACMRPSEPSVSVGEAQNLRWQ
jgi:hypothetical protein